MIKPIPPELRYAAVLILLAFLSGWVWLQAFSVRLDDMAERLVLAIGLSLALTTLAAMLAVYLPGPLTDSQLLIINNVLIGGGLIIIWRQRGGTRSPVARNFTLIFVALVILAAALRLPRLGYAEFHEDEAEALMLGVRLLQGEDYALFLHRKGPAQMLTPVSFWLLTGRLDETLARFPFAFSSILSATTLFFMGRRWFNWPAGLIAGLLWAVNGYAIGFGRMVQYQALIFFLGPLAIYCLYLAWQENQPRLQIPAAILLAACLLAHFDALLLLPAAGYLIWLNLNRQIKEQPSKAVTVLAVLLFLALLAAFYIPYLLDPEFEHTVSYLAESRVKPGFLYNNLKLLRRLDQDYSSHFYLPLVALGLLSFAVGQTLGFAQKWRWAALGLALLGGSTLWRPEVWQSGSSSLAGLPWLLLGLIYIWLSPSLESRTAWLMVGLPFIGYVFLVDDPRTHLYIIYPGAALLAGAGWAILTGKTTGWRREDKGTNILTTSPPSMLGLAAKVFGLIIGVLLVTLVVVYNVAVFLQTETSFSRLQTQWESSNWEMIYDDLPQPRTYFGYPKREGWKTIGALRAQGHFSGDFRSINEDFIIPIWYNYGQARSCYNTPAHFFVRSTGDEPPSTEYVETGQVQREGEVRLRIFSKQAETLINSPVYPLEKYEDTFDQLATPLQFAQQAEPTQKGDAQFGSAIKFVGYNLPTTTVAAGETLYLDLYWQALENPGRDYRAFVHLTDGATLWGQQDDDPACRLPTSIWRAGQRGMGQFRLPVNPETPPGHYPLIIGLYRADTLERLKITGGAGQPGDDFLWLRDIEITRR
ncbi:MAG: glycosyltransferase family 39 protein [Anaerolineae bacterium]|nr:glycosyltransferase family 39 protein [Anaerolineae bacterium]